MIHWVLAGLMVIHGLIHLLGTIQEFGIAKIEDFSGETIISLSTSMRKAFGIAWFAVFGSFILSAIAIINRESWWLRLSIVAIVMSQILIIIWWSDAKFGSIANLLIILGLIYISFFGLEV